MRLGTIVGYGSGSQILAVKAFEASKALEQGANQIDCVLNAGAMLSGDDEIVYNDMLAVVDMAHSALAVAGVIVESDPMSDDLVSRACRIAERAGADYVVTSWGEVPARRTVQRAALLRDSVGPRVQVKASGRFRTLADVLGRRRRRCAGLGELTRAGQRGQRSVHARAGNRAAGGPTPVSTASGRLARELTPRSGGGGRVRILVAGGAGYVGSTSVEVPGRRPRRRRLRRPVDRPRRLGHQAGAPGPRLGPGPDTPENLLRDERIDAVLHCAAKSLVGEA